MIRDLARQYYVSPWIIAERSTFQYFITNGKQIFKDENKSQYTDEFEQMFDELLSNFSNDLNELNEEQKSKYNQIAEAVINEFNLPTPKFTSSWIRAFLKRNRLSFRHAHYARRGKIDPTYVKIFVNQVANAVVKYGWNCVFNVDESSVRINNGSTRTVAEIGAENVVIDKDRNEKECFTVIGCCNLLQCHPLVIVSKGKTDRSKLKFQVGSNTPEILLSKNRNGWTNEDVMLQYLSYFHENIAQKKECALIVDCLSSHRTPSVIQKASILGIELIFVPANGTGYYQPLDRRLFGVLKSKLRSLAGSEAFSGPERYSIITGHLLEAWESISSNELVLKEAWDIKGLYKLADYKQKHFGEADEDEFIMDFDEEEDKKEEENDDIDDDIVEEEDDDESDDSNNEEDEDFVE